MYTGIQSCREDPRLPRPVCRSRARTGKDPHEIEKHNEVEAPGAQDAFTARLVETEPSTLGEIQRVGHNSLIVRSTLSWKHGQLFFPAVCPQCLA